jgi:hypothetical protein
VCYRGNISYSHEELYRGLTMRRHKDIKEKTEFKDLSNLLKAIAIYGAISLFWSIIVFISALIIGFKGGL